MPIEQKPLYFTNAKRLKEFRVTEINNNKAVNRKDEFHELYEKLYTPVFYFACKFVGRQDAEDIVANSFLKLWTSDLDLSVIPKIKTWLNVCTKNACIDFLKSKNKLPTKSLEDIDFANLALQSENEFQITEELIKKLHREIEKLPSKCKQVFKMSYLEGMRVREIAEILHISENTVTNHRAKGFKLLRLAFKGSTLMLVLLSTLLAFHTAKGPEKILDVSESSVK